MSLPPSPSARPRRWLRILGEIALVVTLFLGISAWQGRSIAMGQVQPLTGALLDGGQFDLKGFEGRPALIHFWAPWCGTCRMEAHNIAALTEDHAVISVAMRSPAEDVRRYFEMSGNRFPVILDEDGAISTRFGVRGVPASLIVDPAGKVRYAAVGYTTEIGLRLRLWAAGQGF